MSYVALGRFRSRHLIARVTNKCVKNAPSTLRTLLYMHVYTLDLANKRAYTPIPVFDHMYSVTWCMAIRKLHMVDSWQQVKSFPLKARLYQISPHFSLLYETISQVWSKWSMYVHTYYSLLSSKPRNIERAWARETPCITSLWKNASCCQSWTANERWTEIMHPGAFTPSSSSCHNVAKLILGYYRLFLTRLMQSFVTKNQRVLNDPLDKEKLSNPNNLLSLFG